MIVCPVLQSLRVLHVRPLESETGSCGAPKRALPVGASHEPDASVSNIAYTRQGSEVRM